MLQSTQNQGNAPKYSPSPNTFTPPKNISSSMEQATIGRSVVIKGEVSGAESLYVDGRIEGTVNFADSRVTIGRSGVIVANINAKEVVIMGTVTGNIHCTDRLDIRSEGSLTGDVVTPRICVEDGAVLKGGVEVRCRTTDRKSAVEDGRKLQSPLKPRRQPPPQPERDVGHAVIRQQGHVQRVELRTSPRKWALRIRSSVPFIFHLLNSLFLFRFVLFQIKRGRIHAVAQARRRWTVGKTCPRCALQRAQRASVRTMP